MYFSALVHIYVYIYYIYMIYAVYIYLYIPKYTRDRSMHDNGHRQEQCLNYFLVTLLSITDGGMFQHFETGELRHIGKRSLAITSIYVLHEKYNTIRKDSLGLLISICIMYTSKYMIATLK